MKDERDVRHHAENIMMIKSPTSATNTTAGMSEKKLMYLLTQYWHKTEAFFGASLIYKCLRPKKDSAERLKYAAQKRRIRRELNELSDAIRLESEAKE